MLIAFVFSILLILYKQDTFAPFSNFEVGHFACHFFLSLLLWKEFNSHNFVVTFHFSCSLSPPPVFYSAMDDCWIYINIGCSACIYSIPSVVSLNDEYWLTHRRQQSAGSAFQFHYTEFDKHMKKAGGHISQNVVEITIKMKTIVQKPLKIKIIKLHLRNSDN